MKLLFKEKILLTPWEDLLVYKKLSFVSLAYYCKAYHTDGQFMSVI